MTTSPPPPGGTPEPDDDPYASPHEPPGPPEPPSSEGYPARPEQDRPQQGEHYQQHQQGQPPQGQPQQGQPQQGQPPQGQPQQQPQQGQPYQQPSQGQPHEGQPYQQPPQGQPHEGQPYQQPPQGQPHEGQPYQQPPQGQPQEGQPYQQPPQGQPQEGQPYQGQPHQGQPQHGEPYQGAQPQQGEPPPPPPPHPGVYPPEPEFPPYRRVDPPHPHHHLHHPHHDPSASTHGTGGGDYPPQPPPQPGAYEPPGYGQPFPPAGGGGGGGGYWPPPGAPGGPGGYGAHDPYDPIVASDFNTWVNRVQGVFMRSWKSIGLLMLVGAVIPGIITGTTVNTAVGPMNNGNMNDNWDWGSWAGGGLWGLLAWVITGFLSAAAIVGAIRAAVREGTPGVHVPFGESMSYGFGRAIPMWGWTILASITIAIGLCACVLPGIYLAVALSVIAPAFVFEGGNPYVRSFKLTHFDFGRALSRMIVIFLIALVYGCVLGLPIGLLEGAIRGSDGSIGFGGFIALLFLEAIRAIIMLPLVIFVVAGVLVTYAELRGRQERGTLSTPRLVSEADAIANR